MQTRLQFPRAGQRATSFTAAGLAQRYGYPVVASSNEWVAIIELGGGYSLSDIRAYCDKVGCPVPSIKEVSIGGAKNSFTGDPNGADGEVALDMQNVIGATGGKVGLLMVWAPNTDAGFSQAIAAVAQAGIACALSISWGLNERGWSASAMMAMNTALDACWGAKCIPFAASGDDGSSDGGQGNQVDFPASSPSCVGCGGTFISASGTETAWTYGGGGLSAAFARPAWQAIGGTRRGVPDVAGDADPNSGYAVVINGRWTVIAGTSAVPPMWAALIALITTVNGGKRFDDFRGLLYKQTSLTDVTSGTNGAFKAATGWDPCTGLGVPSAAFTAFLTGMQPAPVPPPVPTPTPGPTTTRTFTVSGTNLVITEGGRPV